MNTTIAIINNPAFTSFISTFGLATLLVLYFIFIRDPKRDKMWGARYDNLIDEDINRYDHLLEAYNELSQNYQRLEEDLRPHRQAITIVQAEKLCDIALDRDLYKLYVLCCRIIDGDKNLKLESIITESVVNTNTVWGYFTSPFPQILHINELFEVYSTQGSTLKGKLKQIIENPKDTTKSDLWDFLFNNELAMSEKFRTAKDNHEKRTTVEPFPKNQESSS